MVRTSSELLKNKTNTVTPTKYQSNSTLLLFNLYMLVFGTY